jgi:hypothetical protein
MSELSQAGQGRAAARRLWEHGVASDVALEDPLNSEFAVAALEEFERLQQGTPGLMLEVLADH